MTVDSYPFWRYKSPTMEETHLVKKEKRSLKRNLRVTFVCAEEAVIEDKTPTVYDEEIGQRVAKKRSVPLKEHCGVSIDAQIFT